MSWYDTNAAELAARYEALDPRDLHAWMADLLPGEPSLVVDVGAGTGRDAAWFAAAGHEVVAIEPSPAMRAEGQRHDAPRVRWLDDSLPSLASTLLLGLAADVVLTGVVWQHVAPADRARAFRKLVTLLGSGGLLVMTLRRGPDDGRGSYEVSADEVERLARDHGLEVVRRLEAEDAFGRLEVRWTNLALRLPDDGTGALPLLRRFILLDAKSSTYKLGLLRQAGPAPGLVPSRRWLSRSWGGGRPGTRGPAAWAGRAELAPALPAADRSGSTAGPSEPSWGGRPGLRRIRLASPGVRDGLATGSREWSRYLVMESVTREWSR